MVPVPGYITKMRRDIAKWRLWMLSEIVLVTALDIILGGTTECNDIG